MICFLIVVFFLSGLFVAEPGDERGKYFTNYSDATISIQNTLPEGNDKRIFFDVKSFKLNDNSRIMDSQEWARVLFLDYPTDKVKDIFFYFCGRVNAVREVSSFLLYAKDINSNQKHLYLINTKEGIIRSSIELSSFYYESDSYHWHTYAVNKDGCFNIYENTVIDIADGPEEPSGKVPLLIRIRCLIMDLFSRGEKRYDLAAKIKIDKNGYSHYTGTLGSSTITIDFSKYINNQALAE